jgi:SAM-dependent methyltransferase
MRERYKIEELACETCTWRDGERCSCINKGRDSDLRLCINAARRDYLSEFKGKLGEVGPGVNSLIRRLSKTNEDLEYIKIKDTVGSLPFADDYLDGIAAGQCMEHWYQRGDTIQDGLTEIYRVLKPGGMLYIDVPVHSHGDPLFLEGDVEKIMAEFPEEMWDVVKVEKRRTPCDPLTPLEYKHNGIEYPLVIIVKAKK